MHLCAGLDTALSRGLKPGAMNYRHAYHAGNFADVVKHALLALVIGHLKQKPAPFRVVDTHAGIGLYDVSAAAALKTGEWRDGIGRVLDARFSPAATAVLAPYLDVVRRLNPQGELVRYPGSPLLARELMRRDDRLIANELHPEDHEELRRLFAGDPKVKVMPLDAWTALKSLLPPPERRGVVLIDPAFEQPGELERLAGGLKEAHRRFATGTFLLWYPIKDAAAVAAFRQRIRDLDLPKVLAIEIAVGRIEAGKALSAAGLIAVNPPFTLSEKMNATMPELARVLARSIGAGFTLEELGAER